MRYLSLGNGGLKVSAIGLGCMGMSQFYGTCDDDRSLQVLSSALDAGITLLDTSDAYGNGHNESVIGRAIRGRRDQVVLATKFGVRGLGSGGFHLDGRPEYVQQACDQSLRRLDVDRIDLYFLHRVDPAVPIEETVGAMAQLVSQGKVAYLGLSEAGPQTLERACRIHPIAALQSEYSVWTRDPEADVLRTCRRLGVGFVAFSPLGRGFFGGGIKDASALAPDDRRRVFPRFLPENLARNVGILESFERIARARGLTAPQLALAWLLSRGTDIVPIPGTRHIERLHENLHALEVRLDPEDVAAIDRICGPYAFAGERYQPSDIALVAP